MGRVACAGAGAGAGSGAQCLLEWAPSKLHLHPDMAWVQINLVHLDRPSWHGAKHTIASRLHATADRANLTGAQRKPSLMKLEFNHFKAQ